MRDSVLVPIFPQHVYPSQSWTHLHPPQGLQEQEQERRLQETQRLCWSKPHSPYPLNSSHLYLQILVFYTLHLPPPVPGKLPKIHTSESQPPKRLNAIGTNMLGKAWMFCGWLKHSKDLVSHLVSLTWWQNICVCMGRGGARTLF